MHPFGFARLTLVLLLSSSLLTIQVSIKLSPFDQGAEYYWEGVRPGWCAQVPLPYDNYLLQFYHAEFAGLTAMDIAAVWKKRIVSVDHHIAACSGAVLQSRRGPDFWRWNWDDPVIELNRKRATGASYISLPKGLPPDDGSSDWLTAEGILGFVWGGGKYFVSGAAYQAASLLVPGRAPLPTNFPRLRRDIRSSVKGTVFARPPNRAVYPTIIKVEGVNYTDGCSGDLNYRDDDGVVLNLTTLSNT
ncbi:MAG: hypothetical protein L6R37_005260 [Teloschistes peruensis]|nr:MAG: hypothetical protein L6R37_005260 [Teloschistes peruensis]